MTLNSRGGLEEFDFQLAEYQIRNILEHAKEGKLLDLGCNDGYILWALNRYNKFIRMLGVDMDEKKIAHAQRYGFATFQCSTIEDFECHEKFDTITLINVLEHVDDPMTVLNKARTWLSRNGVLIIHVPNSEGLNRRLGLKMGLIKSSHELSDRDVKVGHKRFFNQSLLKVMTENAGLKVASMGGVMLKPFSNNQMQRVSEWDNGSSILDGLYELARTMPEYSSPIWAVCTL